MTTQEKSPETDDTLAVWFTPQTIRDHFEYDEESAIEPDDVERWVAGATDDQLVRVGRACLGSDSLWRLFHELLEEVIREDHLA